jgi:hypothetical protein
VISTDGSNTIRLGNTGLCLTTQGDGETNGENINVMSCDETHPKTQQFQYDSKLNRIVNMQGRKVLDGSNFALLDGSNVWVRPLHVSV